MKRVRFLMFGIGLSIALLGSAFAQSHAASVAPISCFDSSFAIDASGDLYGWGGNMWGTNFSADKYGPEALILEDIVSVESGQWTAFAIDSSGSLWGWGSTQFGLLPDTFTGKPIRVLGGVKAVAIGSRHIVALKSDSTLWSWGRNENSQMAGKTTADKVPAGSPIQLMSDITSVVANEDTTYALSTDGTLYGWGGAVVTESGCGPAASPAAIMKDVKSIAAVHEGLLVIKSDDSLWVKGASALLTDEGCTYAKFTKLLDSVAFCNPGVAIQKDGSLLTWGNNHSGQLADNTLEHRCAPTKVADGILYAETGMNCTMAVKDTGELVITDDSSATAGFHAVLQNSMLPSTFGTIQCIPYTDVSEIDWFYKYARECYTAGLLNGVGGNQFAPTLNLTEEQAVAVAVRLSIQSSGDELPVTDGAGWYAPFREYAIQNKILFPDEVGERMSSISRYRFAELLSRVPHLKSLPSINNSVNIPDVDKATALGSFISILYDAGVFSGVDKTGAFHGEASITRSEVAAILSRISNPTLRIHL